MSILSNHFSAQSGSNTGIKFNHLLTGAFIHGNQAENISGTVTIIDNTDYIIEEGNTTIMPGKVGIGKVASTQGLSISVGDGVDGDTGIALTSKTGGDRLVLNTTLSHAGGTATPLFPASRGAGWVQISDRNSSTDYRTAFYLIRVIDNGVTIASTKIGEINPLVATFTISSGYINVSTSIGSSDATCFGMFQQA